MRLAASRRHFADAAARYVPGITADDLEIAAAVGRAQALGRDGSLVEDFVFTQAQGMLHVRNAPSPAATASLAIARLVADRAEDALAGGHGAPNRTLAPCDRRPLPPAAGHRRRAADLLGGSVELAQAAVAAGVEVIVATPHVSPEYPNRPEAIERLAGRVVKRLAKAGVDVEVHAVGELAAGAVSELTGAQLRALTLGAGRWLLLECPFLRRTRRRSKPSHGACRAVASRSCSRTPSARRRSSASPSLPPRPRRRGNALLDHRRLAGGPFRETPRSTALALADAGLVHNVASDAHNTGDARPGHASRSAPRDSAS